MKKINLGRLLMIILPTVTLLSLLALVLRVNTNTNNEYLALGEFYSKKCSIYNSDDLIYKENYKGKTLIKCDNSIYFVDSISYIKSIEYYKQHSDF
ncbi:hypothetical protein GKR75_07885 [Providencia sp. wls1919]|nr:hypothetical protein [Providencia sp. wls1919]